MSDIGRAVAGVATAMQTLGNAAMARISTNPEPAEELAELQRVFDELDTNSDENFEEKIMRWGKRALSLAARLAGERDVATVRAHRLAARLEAYLTRATPPPDGAVERVVAEARKVLVGWDVNYFRDLRDALAALDGRGDALTATQRQDVEHFRGVMAANPQLRDTAGWLVAIIDAHLPVPRKGGTT